MNGPNLTAAKIRDELDDLGARLEQWPSRKERSRINKRVHILKELLRWCETRSGYVKGA